MIAMVQPSNRFSRWLWRHVSSESLSIAIHPWCLKWSFQPLDVKMINSPWDLHQVMSILSRTLSTWIQLREWATKELLCRPILDVSTNVWSHLITVLSCTDLPLETTIASLSTEQISMHMDRLEHTLSLAKVGTPITQTSKHPLTSLSMLVLNAPIGQPHHRSSASAQMLARQILP
jgi:hypothetical protein